MDELTHDRIPAEDERGTMDAHGARWLAAGAGAGAADVVFADDAAAAVDGAAAAAARPACLCLCLRAVSRSLRVCGWSGWHEAGAATAVDAGVVVVVGVLTYWLADSLTH